MLFPPFFKIPSENKSNFPEGFIDKGNVFEIHLLKYKDPSIPQEKIDKFINFMKQDKLNLFTELVKHYREMGLDNTDEISTGFTDDFNMLSKANLFFQMKNTEDRIFNQHNIARLFWKSIFNEYVRDVIPIIQFRLVGTYWSDMAFGASSQYMYYRESSVMANFDIDTANYSKLEKSILISLNLSYPSRVDDFNSVIGTKVGSRNLRNPGERPYVELEYSNVPIILQPMKMIFVKQLMGFYSYLNETFGIITPFKRYIDSFKGFNFYYTVGVDYNKFKKLPPEEGDLKAIYDKWFNRTNPNLKYPDYYGINYLKTPISVKQFNTQQELYEWNKLP